MAMMNITTTRKALSQIYGENHRIKGEYLAG